jgi:hypothetical protein
MVSKQTYWIILYLYIYIYIYIYVCVCVCVCVEYNTLWHRLFDGPRPTNIRLVCPGPKYVTTNMQGWFRIPMVMVIMTVFRPSSNVHNPILLLTIIIIITANVFILYSSFIFVSFFFKHDDWYNTTCNVCIKCLCVCNYK